MNFCHSSLIDLQNIKTQKLTKASENKKVKGLTNVNQGVQIHNIWHSSRARERERERENTEREKAGHAVVGELAGGAVTERERERVNTERNRKKPRMRLFLNRI